MAEYILCADVGGTNTNLAIMKCSRNSYANVLSYNINTQNTSNIVDPINTFLAVAKAHNITTKFGCIAVAGAVKNQRVEMTNSSMIIDGAQIKKHTPLNQVLIVNDMVALGAAIEVLQKDQISILKRGHKAPWGNKAIVGPGTGLGKCLLSYIALIDMNYPDESEGGHADLPIYTKDEFHFIDFAQKFLGKTCPITYEDVLSGRGLELLYAYHLSGSKKGTKPLSAIAISKQWKSNPLAKATFKSFMKWYARCCKNYALETLAIGGIYMTGGIVSKNPHIYSAEFQKIFRTEFCNHDRFKDLLQNIPVYVVKEYDVSLIGAAHFFNKLFIQKVSIKNNFS